MIVLLLICFTGWDWECLQDWGAFTELAVSGLAMTGLEWGSFEIAIFIAGNRCVYHAHTCSAF